MAKRNTHHRQPKNEYSRSGVAVVVPVYNEEHAVLSTLHSLSGQKRSPYKDDRYIFVDNVSTDDTANIIDYFRRVDEAGRKITLLGWSDSHNFPTVTTTSPSYVMWVDGSTGGSATDRTNTFPAASVLAEYKGTGVSSFMGGVNQSVAGTTAAVSSLKTSAIFSRSAFMRRTARIALGAWFESMLHIYLSCTLMHDERQD